jgi:hypothetical protein
MHDPLREREPETGTVSGARGVGPEERVEDVREIRLTDPLARVLHDQAEDARIPAALDPDRPVRGRVTDGIHEQVLKDPDHMR